MWCRAAGAAMLCVTISLFAGPEEAESNPLTYTHLPKIGMAHLLKGVGIVEFAIDIDCGVLVGDSPGLQFVYSGVSRDHQRLAARGKNGSTWSPDPRWWEVAIKWEWSNVHSRPFQQIACRCGAEILAMDDHTKIPVGLRVFGKMARFNKDIGAQLPLCCFFRAFDQPPGGAPKKPGGNSKDASEYRDNSRSQGDNGLVVPLANLKEPVQKQARGLSERAQKGWNTLADIALFYGVVWGVLLGPMLLIMAFPRKRRKPSDRHEANKKQGSDK